VRPVFTGGWAFAKGGFAALVVGVRWCAWGSVAVPPVGTGGFAWLVGGVTGCTRGWVGVSVLGILWSSVLGGVLGRCAGESVVVPVFVTCGSVVLLVGVRVCSGG